MRFSTQRGADAADAYDEQLAARLNSPEGKAALAAERDAAIQRAEKAGLGFEGWVSKVSVMLARHPEPAAAAAEEARLLYSEGEGMWRLTGASAGKHAGIMPTLAVYRDACQYLAAKAKGPGKTWTLAERRAAEKAKLAAAAAKDTPKQRAAAAKYRAEREAASKVAAQMPPRLTEDITGEVVYKDHSLGVIISGRYYRCDDLSPSDKGQTVTLTIEEGQPARLVL